MSCFCLATWLPHKGLCNTLWPFRNTCCFRAFPSLCHARVALQAAKKIAKQVSERGGGLQAVEAMALPYGDGECALGIHLC